MPFALPSSDPESRSAEGDGPAVGRTTGDTLLHLQIFQTSTNAATRHLELSLPALRPHGHGRRTQGTSSETCASSHNGPLVSTPCSRSSPHIPAEEWPDIGGPWNYLSSLPCRATGSGATGTRYDGAWSAPGSQIELSNAPRGVGRPRCGNRFATEAIFVGLGAAIGGCRVCLCMSRSGGPRLARLAQEKGKHGQLRSTRPRLPPAEQTDRSKMAHGLNQIKKI